MTSRALAECHWLVFNEYTENLETGRIEGMGKTSIRRLDLTNVQDDLLSDFIKVDGVDAARTFTNNWGTLVPDLSPETVPIEDPSAEVQYRRKIRKSAIVRVVEAASSVNWLMQLISAMSGDQEDLGLFSDWVKPSTVKPNPVSYVEHELFHGRLKPCEKAVQEAGGIRNFEKRVNEKFRSKKDLDRSEEAFMAAYEASQGFIKSCTYLSVAPTAEDKKQSALKNFTGFYRTNNFIERSLEGPLSCDEPIEFQTSYYLRCGELGSLYAVQAYIKRALDLMMKNINPQLEWINPSGTDSGWSLALRLGILCPLDAITYALVRKATRKPGFKSCDWCQKLFPAKRSDARACSRACGEQLRKKEPLREYTKTKC